MEERIAAGDRIAGRFRLVRPLGAGGMGEVWEAEDEQLGRRVALKRLAVGMGDAVAEARFAREARAAAQLRHPNVVMVHDSMATDEGRFLIMELASGQTLRARIDSGTREGPASLAILRDVASALAALHGCGIVHRDVKPENVIVRDDGSACLVDLGIAKWVDHALAPTEESIQPVTAEDLVVGTPDYLPPEARFAGVHDERGDQWAWGTLAYELLTGVHPRDVAERPLAEMCHVDASIVQTVERARAKSPSERFLSMAEVVSALAAAGVSAPSEPREPRASSKAPGPAVAGIAIAPGRARARRATNRGRERNTVRTFLVALLVTAAIGGLALVTVFVQRGRASTNAPAPSSSGGEAPEANAPADAHAAAPAASVPGDTPDAAGAAETGAHATVVVRRTTTLAPTQGGKCACLGSPSLPYLCPVETRVVSAGACATPDHAWLCAGPLHHGGCIQQGREGQECSGYDSKGEKRTGRIEGASVCPRDSDVLWRYRGKPGAACRGLLRDGTPAMGKITCTGRRSEE